nr:hypothetical protein BaRGS_025893 [Batillaria attramentaria]
MSRGAEESLMALLEAMLTLAAQDVSMRRPKPTIKPGGYQEEIFVDLSEEEKDEMSCSICYQVLKETMQCVNRHKFCHSCLYVWSTTGQYANRVRCPVCRAHGYYFRNEDLDQRIGCKKVRRSTNNRISISHTDNNNNQAHNSSSTSLAGSEGCSLGVHPHHAKDSKTTICPTSAQHGCPSQPARAVAARSSTPAQWKQWSGLRHPQQPQQPSTLVLLALQHGLGENLTEIRDRLQESRSRLDTLMTTFNGELERSRQEMAEFQVERERQRQEQLNEVRELGRRLGQVASELRRLLDHRRPFRPSDD